MRLWAIAMPELLLIAWGSVFIDFINSNCIFIQPDESRKNIDNGIGGNNANGGRENIRNIPFQQYETLQNKRNDNRTLSGEINDRTRNDVISELETINRRIRKTSSNLAESISGFEESKRGLDEAIGTTGNALSSFKRTAKEYLDSTRNITTQFIEKIKNFVAEQRKQPEITKPELQSEEVKKSSPSLGRF